METYLIIKESNYKVEVNKKTSSTEEVKQRCDEISTYVKNTKVFTHVSELGKGADAKVIKVEDGAEKDKHLALKIPLDKVYNSLEKEKEILSKLDHPNIIKYQEHNGKNILIKEHLESVDGGHVDAEDDDDSFVFLDEFTELGDNIALDIKSGSLSDGYKEMTVEQKENVITQCLGAVDYLESKNIIHGDIKLENILLDNEGNPCLSDFGTSFDKKDETLKSVGIGTINYMAPEAYHAHTHSNMDADYNPKGLYSWSMGMTILEMFT